MSNNFAFGGVNTSLVFSRWQQACVKLPLLALGDDPDAPVLWSHGAAPSPLRELMQRVAAVARALPEGRHLINLCEHRYASSSRAARRWCAGTRSCCRRRAPKASSTKSPLRIPAAIAATMQFVEDAPCAEGPLARSC